MSRYYLKWRCRHGRVASADKVVRACLWLLAAAPLLAPASAWAGEYRGQPVVTLVAPPILDAARSITSKPMSAVFADGDQVASTELAAQRGGAGGVVPIASAPQTIPQIILWDELKAQMPNGGSQGTNRITIQIR